MDRLEKTLKMYEEKFGENFPILCFRGATDDVIIGEAERCMRTDTPFEAPDENDY